MRSQQDYYSNKLAGNAWYCPFSRAPSRKMSRNSWRLELVRSSQIWQKCVKFTGQPLRKRKRACYLLKATGNHGNQQKFWWGELRWRDSSIVPLLQLGREDFNYFAVCKLLPSHITPKFAIRNLKVSEWNQTSASDTVDQRIALDVPHRTESTKYTSLTLPCRHSSLEFQVTWHYDLAFQVWHIRFQ